MRIIVVVVTFVAIVAAAILGPKYLELHDRGSHEKAGDQPVAGDYTQTCDLLATPCVWTSGEARWEVELTEISGSAESSAENSAEGAEYQLSIKTSESPERFLAVLRGESMYMGEYPVPLKESAHGVYQARFTAPVCTVDSTMIWRIDLQSGQSPIVSQQAKLTFEAEGH